MDQTGNIGENLDSVRMAQAVLDIVDWTCRHHPYPSHSVLRSAPGLPPGPLGIRSVSRHAECEEILQNPAWSDAGEARLLHPKSDNVCVLVGSANRDRAPTTGPTSST